MKFRQNLECKKELTFQREEVFGANMERSFRKQSLSLKTSKRKQAKIDGNRWHNFHNKYRSRNKINTTV